MDFSPLFQSFSIQDHGHSRPKKSQMETNCSTADFEAASAAAISAAAASALQSIRSGPMAIYRYCGKQNIAFRPFARPRSIECQTRQFCGAKNVTDVLTERDEKAAISVLFVGRSPLCCD